MIDLSLFDPTKYNLSQIDQGWAIILVAVLGGIFAAMRAVIRSRRGIGTKFLGVGLLSIINIVFVLAVYYVAIIVPQSPKPISIPTNTNTSITSPVVFQARLANNYMWAILRSAPAPNAPIVRILDVRDITIHGQLEGEAPSSKQTKIWYSASARVGNEDLTGYIYGDSVELIPPSDNPQATPSLITLTPTPSS